MKLILICLFTFLVIPAVTEASVSRKLYLATKNEIHDYYADSGLYKVISIARVKSVSIDAPEFTAVSAEVRILNKNSNRQEHNNCLVSFITEGLELHSINCF